MTGANEAVLDHTDLFDYCFTWRRYPRFSIPRWDQALVSTSEDDPKKESILEMYVQDDGCESLINF